MKKILPILFTLTVLAGFAGSATAQIQPARQAKVDLDKVEVQMQKTPEYQIQTSDSKKTPKNREWLEIEAKFETKSDSKIGFIDALVFKYYVAIAGAEAVVLNDTITYENIPDDEEMYTVVYVHPASLAKLVSAKDKFKMSDVKAVGVEILFNGEIKATYSSTNSPFWNSGGNFSVRNGLILPKEKTPFAFAWIDRHASAQLTR